MTTNTVNPPVDYAAFPDAQGRFGQYGGRFVSETLMHALDELQEIYTRVKSEPSFQAEFDKDLAHYVGRPSPLYHAERMSNFYGGAQIYLKREDLSHTGAHKVIITIGQALLPKYTSLSTNPKACRCLSQLIQNMESTYYLTFVSSMYIPTPYAVYHP